jgi:hypothetical protein
LVCATEYPTFVVMTGRSAARTLLARRVAPAMAEENFMVD